MLRPRTGQKKLEAYRLLKAYVLNGAAPGEALSELPLARRFGLGRTPVREAIHLLARDGLIELNPNRGARVVALDLDDFVKLLQMRAVLEGLSARLAAGVADKDRIADLEDRFRRQAARRNRSAGTMERLSADFHLFVADASGNVHLTQAIEALLGKLTLMRRQVWHDARVHPEIADRSFVEHLNILRALRGGDPDEAEQTMRRHIIEPMRELVRHLAASDTPRGRRRR